MQRKPVIIIAGVLLLGALGAIWWQLKPPMAKFNRAPIVGVGQVTVDEIAHVLHDRGRIVVVIPAPPGSTAQVMPPNGLWEGFRDELKKHSGINIAATEFAATDVAGCSSAAFKEVWERHPDVDAFVFFVGMPLWNEVSAWVRQRAAPQVFVVDIDTPPLKRRYGEYFASGMLRVLIGMRTDHDAVLPTNPQTPRDWFRTQYQVYTPGNYEAWLN